MPLTIMPDVNHSATDFYLDEARLAALWNAEDKHFWHAARNKWILLFLNYYLHSKSASILDVGCGSGGVAKSLVCAGYHLTGVDTAEVLLRRAHLRVPGAHFICGELSLIPLSCIGTYDVITFFDVLEHLDEPIRILQSALRFAKSGSLVMVTVPSQMKLFSNVDIVSGHKRRYERNELSELLRCAGLREVEEHGIFRMLSLFIKLRRRPIARDKSLIDANNKALANEILMRDLRVPPMFLNFCAGMVCRLEQIFFPWSRNNSGASLLGVGRVP
jgi:2-polyprenyl-3-methyl-5-hydroxy-6-metoxy-1,4-benzoquinol methylase